jgi:Leucine-rich repeat (LRR) protein
MLCRNIALTNLPSGVPNTTITLDVSYNNISHLTAALFANKGMSQLTYLFIYNNAITNIDAEAFGSLTNLKSLFIGMNHLTYIQRDTFAHNTKLEELDLHGNNISLEDEGPFHSLISLSVLNLARCNLKSIPKGIFQKTVKLSKLDMSNNKLTHIDDHVFENLESLKFLNLSANLLKSIDFLRATSITNLRKISLYIGNNRLDGISDDILKRIGYLKNLNIHQNPFLCSCWYRNCSEYIKGWETQVGSCLNTTTSTSVTETTVTMNVRAVKAFVIEETHSEVPEIQLTTISVSPSELNFSSVGMTDVTVVPIQQESRNPLEASVGIYVFVSVAVVILVAAIVIFIRWIRKKKSSVPSAYDSLQHAENCQQDGKCDVCRIYENYTPNCDHRFLKRNANAHKKGEIYFATQSTLETYEVLTGGETEECCLYVPLNEEVSIQHINSNSESGERSPVSTPDTCS